MVHSFVRIPKWRTTLKIQRLSLSQSCTQQQGIIPKKIVFLGTPQVAASSLYTLYSAAMLSSINGGIPFEIVRVVSQPPVTLGRKQVLTPSPVHVLANSLNIPVMTPMTAKDEIFLSALENLNVDLFITAAYGNYLPKRFLSIPKYGTINIHPSLLPKYRGAAPVQRCLEQGDNITGVSILFSVAKMDAGPILAQIPYPLKGDENASKVLEDCFNLGINKLIASFPVIFSGEVQSQKQDDRYATNAPKIESTESFIDFASATARQIHNKGRAFSEWPGIYGYFKLVNRSNGAFEIARIKILSTIVIADGETGVPENEVTIVKIDGKDTLQVACKGGSKLGIVELQPAGRKSMNVRAFANGLRDRSIEYTTPPVVDHSISSK